ncbi:MAG TPA: 5-oxoprolinase subunit PxpB [Burkholderiales bacterium]|jgi:KipI family sensor histidine kinase inhibitor
MAKKALEPKAVVPLGDCAAYIEFADKLDLEVNAFMQQLAAAVHARGRPWLRDVVPALGGIALHYDPDHPDVHGDALEAAAILVQECMKDEAAGEEAPVRTVEVPVCYAREFAPDVEEVARQLRLDAGEVARTHAAGEYRVLMIGFAPGHAYMSGLDPKLAVPRRSAPRALVAPGAVAIANEQTVIYPYAISGGWNVIGRTPLAVFDAAREAPSLFSAGDRVRFRPISADEFMALHR